MCACRCVEYWCWRELACGFGCIPWYVSYFVFIFRIANKRWVGHRIHPSFASVPFNCAFHLVGVRATHRELGTSPLWIHHFIQEHF